MTLDLRLEPYNENLYAELSFPPPPPGRPYVFSNMVSSMDGKAVVEGTEKGLGSKADQRLMRRLRTHADMVLTGAGTFRASGAGARIDDDAMRAWRIERGKTPNPIAATVTSTGSLDTSRQFFTAGDYDAVVFAGPGVSTEAEARIRDAGRKVVRIAEGSAGLAELASIARNDFGVERLLVEGGPTVLAELLHLDVVDEFFQTIGGKVVGGRGTLTIVEGERFSMADLREFGLLSVVVNGAEDELYLRWRRKPPRLA